LLSVFRLIFLLVHSSVFHLLMQTDSNCHYRKEAAECCCTAVRIVAEGSMWRVLVLSVQIGTRVLVGQLVDEERTVVVAFAVLYDTVVGYLLHFVGILGLKRAVLGLGRVDKQLEVSDW